MKARRMIGVAGLAVAVLVSCKGKQPEDPYKAMRGRIMQYVNVLGLSEIKQEPYVNGKILVVNPKSRDIDEIHMQLPDCRRAVKPDEVGTIVWVEKTSENCGTYNTGTNAVQELCKVTIIDKSIPAIIYEVTFRGGEPPNSFMYHGSAPATKAGKSPVPNIVKFLSNLQTKDDLAMAR